METLSTASVNGRLRADFRPGLLFTQFRISLRPDAGLIEADANRRRSIPGVEWKKQIDPQAASRAVKEYLATLNDAAFGAATEVQPKFVSPSDPAVDR